MNQRFCRRSGPLQAWIMLSAWVCSGHSATFTAGSDGTYATIQSAINAALLAGGSNEVRVESGNYTENLTVTLNAGALDIYGGWNATFTQRNLDPVATEIFGGGTDRVLLATIHAGAMTFSGFDVVGGHSTASGGGIYLVVDNTGSAQIRSSHFVFNTVQATGIGNALGGAFYADLSGSGALIFDGNVVDTNSATTADTEATGGGVWINASNSANAALSNNAIQNNVATASGSGQAAAGGAYFSLHGSARITVDRTDFINNSLQASDGFHATISGAFFSAGCTGACEFDAVLSRFDRNHGFGEAQFSVGLGGATAAKCYIADVLVSRGDGLGMFLQTDKGVTNVVNATVADNATTGIYLVPNSTITLYNTIAYGNAGDLTTFGNPAQVGNNLISIDPHFVDAANGDFHIKADSAARDAGTATPPGGLGLFDLDGNPRTYGPKPDIGAYEVGDEIFKDGFD